MGAAGAAAAGVGDIAGGASGQGQEQQLTSAQQRELRRKARMGRKQGMLELEKAKPSDSFDDPQDVEAIALAKATMGNYMLKASPDYKVPENQRINAEKKRRQMFLLEESVHAIKMEFTQKVLALREFRQEVKKSVAKDLLLLEQMGGKETADFYKEIIEQVKSKHEYPERRFDFSDDDLEKFRLKLEGKYTEPV